MSAASDLFVVGLSHRTAPLAVRERLAVPADVLPGDLQTLTSGAKVREGLLVSTCNRVELYAACDDAVAALDVARRYFRERGDEDVDRYLYLHRGGDAVRHAFRVTASLDSMVVGEPQILGQVKDAYSAAEQVGTLGTVLGRCFTRAFAAAKRVRTETGIASGTVSVSSVAVDLAKKIFGELRGRRVLLIGAGEMGEAAAKSLANGGSELVVVNRSPEKAEALAEACGGVARPYEQLTAELVRADVVITSTSSPRPILTTEVIGPVVKARKRRPIFLVDIAVPRDVDPRVSNLENVFLYDVDDLEKVAADNLAARKREAEAAERIIAVEVDEFERWRRSLELTPTIKALRQRFRDVVRAELERTVPRLGNLSPKERKSLEAMADAMVNKLLHRPVTELKRRAENGDGAALVDAAQSLFDLLPPVGDAEALRRSGEVARPDEGVQSDEAVGRVMGLAAAAGKRRSEGT